MFKNTDNLDQIEEKLKRELTTVTWVGDLAITETDFRWLKSSVRSMIKQPTKIPPRALMASMVFCARYAIFEDDENINFWGRYFKDVLNHDKTPPLENEYRQAFRGARAKLQDEYQFEFPTETTQDVVRGVYLHAILPAYLQDDFAQFFLKQYPNLADWEMCEKMFADEIATQNEKLAFPSTTPRLVGFLQSRDTSITAARLIKTLATAAIWHHEGQDKESISAVLSAIEGQIWRELAPLLPMPGVLKVVSERSFSPRVRWAWLIDQNDILELHAKNIIITGDTPPDRLVWFSLAESAAISVGTPVPEYSDHYCEVNAWHTATGYIIDSATLIDIDSAGFVVAVDEHDNALSDPVLTSAPPTSAPALFRIQPDGQLAILSDQERLSDGDYAVSLPDGVALTDINGQTLQPDYPLSIPRALREHGHTTAGKYTLKLPILLGNTRINKQRSRLSPLLEGDHLVAGLAPGVLPIYEAGDIWLRIDPPSVPLSRLSLRLTINEAASIYSLSDLDSAGQITHESTQDRQTWRIRLSDYLPPACVLQVEVFGGTARMHGDPRVAGRLPPGVHVVASAPENFYTRQNPPTVRLDGINKDQIELASSAEVNANDNSSFVTWVDPRQDAALRVRFGVVMLPITFDVKWTTAWVEPLINGFLWEEALPEARLSVRGASRARFSITVADGEPRSYELNARGVMDIVIEQDALVEMLRAYHGERASVHIKFNGSTEASDLFTFIRPQFSEFEQYPEIVKDAIRAFKTYLRQQRRAALQADLGLLYVLPVEYYTHFPINGLSPDLAAVRSIQQGLYPEARALLPRHQEQLRLSETVVHRLHRDEEGIHIHLDRTFAQQQKMLDLPIKVRDRALFVHASNGLLRQCLRCQDFYWADDSDAKLSHGHGKFGLESHDLTHKPILGTLENQPVALEDLRAFTVRFDAFIAPQKQGIFRIRDRPAGAEVKREAPAPLLTKAAYIQATADYVSNITSDPDVEKSFKRLTKSHEFIDKIIAYCDRQEVPTLVLAGRWLWTERHRDNRKLNDWTMLDPVVMTLAVVARAYAHGYTLLTHDEMTDFRVLLSIAHKYCPKLLLWAMTWAELIFTHFQPQEENPNESN